MRNQDSSFLKLRKNFDSVSHHSMTKNGRFIVFNTYTQLEFLGKMQEGDQIFGHLLTLQEIQSFWPTHIQYCSLFTATTMIPELYCSTRKKSIAMIVTIIRFT